MNTTEPIKWGVVMQVKDEADIIEDTLTRWLMLGPAAILVFDDGSTDGTLQHLRRWEATHPEIAVFTNAREPYQMQQHINMMKRVLIDDDDIRWIIPADADEVWLFPGGDPAVYFATLPQIPSWGEVPYFDNYPNGHRRLHTHRKCFGYLTTEMEISIGNHLIIDGDRYPKIDVHGITIEHYPVRSYDQMKRKLINHMLAYRDQWPGHPHATNYERWQAKGEAFFQEIWQLYNPR